MWTYSGDPSASTLDKVRFLVGDTNTDDQQATDEEINAVLADASDSPFLAAVEIAEALAAKFTRLVDKSVGDLSISYSQRAKAYADLIVRLRRKARMQAGSTVPYAGGLSYAERDTDASNTDLVQPTFAVGMHDRTAGEE